MTASPTRRQLVFLLGSLLLAPLVTLYATQAVWLQSLWAPLPWMASHGGATVLFWVLFSSLSLTLYGFFRRLFPAYLPKWPSLWGWPSPAGISWTSTAHLSS